MPKWAGCEANRAWALRRRQPRIVAACSTESSGRQLANVEPAKALCGRIGVHSRKWDFDWFPYWQQQTICLRTLANPGRPTPHQLLGISFLRGPRRPQPQPRPQPAAGLQRSPCLSCFAFLPPHSHRVAEVARSRGAPPFAISAAVRQIRVPQCSLWPAHAPLLPEFASGVVSAAAAAASLVVI